MAGLARIKEPCTYFEIWKYHGLGLFCCRWAWSAHHHRIHHEFIIDPEVAWGKYDTICRKIETQEMSIMQHDNNLKHSRKSIKLMARNNLWVQEIRSQNPDFNPIGIMWFDLKIPQTSYSWKDFAWVSETRK